MQELRHRRIGAGLPRSPSWHDMKKSMRTYILSSQTNKQFITCCVVSSIVWSLISSILLINVYINKNYTADHCTIDNLLHNNPIIMGAYEGPRWLNTEQTIDRKVLIENKWLSLSQHTVKIKGDQMIDDWLWVDSANQINVLVTTMIDDKEHFVIFEQTKYGYNGLSYATVGGHIDPDDDENGLKAAKRELLEEMGMISDEWIHFGKYRTDVNRGLGFCHTFLARKATVENKLKSFSDETEDMNIKYLTLQQIMVYYKNGLFKEAKWSNTVGLSLMWMLSNTEVVEHVQEP